MDIHMLLFIQTQYFVNRENIKVEIHLSKLREMLSMGYNILVILGLFSDLSYPIYNI